MSNPFVDLIAEARSAFEAHGDMLKKMQQVRDEMLAVKQPSEDLRNAYIAMTTMHDVHKNMHETMRRILTTMEKTERKNEGE
jgi:hypothetical protein